MDSKGIIHETGFNVEMRFHSSRCASKPARENSGAHFFRRIQRFERELDSWMPMSRSIDSNLSQAGHLTGLEDISVERTIELAFYDSSATSARKTRSAWSLPVTTSSRNTTRCWELTVAFVSTSRRP
ncbi:MAG TPA: hypothetical protein VKB05_18725 [Pyrinomonadaceae bacterium]|nr:hypothetical protein [Pyrinomonadaceae bacterium]